jgi:hypothetical protein
MSASTENATEQEVDVRIAGRTPEKAGVASAKGKRERDAGKWWKTRRAA